MIKDRKDTVTASGLEITGSYKLDTTSYPPIERDGYRYAVVELTAGNNWTATFKNLPKYKRLLNHTSKVEKQLLTTTSFLLNVVLCLWAIFR